MRVGLGLDPALEWTLNPGPALRCIVGRHRNVLPQLLLTVLLTITVCVLASSGHSPPGLYKLMKLNVRRSVFSVPNLNLVSITSSPIIREAAAGRRGRRERRETLPKRPKLRLKLVRCVGGQLSGLVEEIVTGLPSASSYRSKAFTYLWKMLTAKRLSSQSTINP